MTDPQGHPTDDADAIASRPVDPAAESLAQALRTGFNLLRVIMIVLVVAYFFSGWFQVGPGEQGLVVRFGELRVNDRPASDEAGPAVYGPGSHLTLPDPIDEKILISGAATQLEIDTFLFVRPPDSAGKAVIDFLQRRDQIDPKVDGTMITGDRSLAHGLWTVEYRIADAEKFVRNIGESTKAFEPMLQVIVEAAVVEVVAGLPVERVTVGRLGGEDADFAATIKRRVADELVKYETGVIVDKITAETVEPGSVRDEFVRVTVARSNRKKDIAEATDYRTRTLSQTAGVATQYDPLLTAIDAYGAAQTRGAGDAELEPLRAVINDELERAGGLVAGRLRTAQSVASETRQRIEREYADFVAWQAQFRAYPHVIASQLWTEMRTAILANKQNELFFLPDTAGIIEIITNRDAQRDIERDLERFKKKP
jgi:membrane protease subunit HflK